MDNDEMIREAMAAPCNMMIHTPPMDFAWCETHDETFPLGAVCSFHRIALKCDAISARANGNIKAERRALDLLALDERVRQPRLEE